MARGNDESNNPRRRPQRPQTDEEKMAIVKQVFPNAREVVSDVDDDEFNPPERGEDAHLDMMYESRYESDYQDYDNGY